MDQVLDIHQALCAQREGQLFRYLTDAVQELVVEVVRRVDRDGVAAMDACPFDMLHNAGDQHVLPVRDDVHFQLDARHILVHQDRVLDAAGQDIPHIAFRGRRIPRNAHALAADDIAGPQQDRISQLFRSLQGVLQTADPASARPRYAEALQQGVKTRPVLCRVDAVGRGSQNRDALL